MARLAKLKDTGTDELREKAELQEALVRCAARSTAGQQIQGQPSLPSVQCIPFVSCPSTSPSLSEREAAKHCCYRGLAVTWLATWLAAWMKAR
jgi:hypothetical protein